MAYSSSEIILTSSSDFPINAYDPSSGNNLAQFSGSRSPRLGLALAGNNLIAASHISPNTASAGFVHLYNWWSPAAFHCIHVPEPVAPIEASPDGYHLFSGSLSGNIYIFSLPSGDLCRSFKAHRQSVSCLAINGDGTLLISGGEDGMIAAFSILSLLDDSSNKQVSSQPVLYRIAAHDSAVTCLAIGPGVGNSSMVSNSLDGTSKFWSITDGTHLQTIQFQCPMWCITVDSTNSAAYAGGADGRVHVIPMKFSGRRQKVEVVAWESAETEAVTAVAMVNGNRNLVSASEEGIIKIWEVESGSIVQVFGHERSGTVSDLLVAKGSRNSQIKDEAAACNGIHSQGYGEREIYRNTMGVEEMEKWLGVAVTDRRRAIDMLEVAIETYESLLGIILKEAKGGGDKEE